MSVEFFSPAQCVGYLAFVLGVTAFSQKIDRRLKLMVGVECLAYTLHFALLGNFPASVSACISSGRCFLALRWRSRLLAALFVGINLAFGLAMVHRPAGWLPVAASCLGSIAIFLLRGIPMRLVLLAATFCWLDNNIVSHSIGGTLLETLIATVNTATMLRLLWPSSKLPDTAPTEQ